MRKTDHYTLGCNKLLIATDHKPLIPILRGDGMSVVGNRRINRLLETLERHRFTKAEYVPGTELHSSDALSRNPVTDFHPEDLEAYDWDVMNKFKCNMVGNNNMGTTITNEADYLEALSNYEEMMLAKVLIENGVMLVS